MTVKTKIGLDYETSPSNDSRITAIDRILGKV